MRFPLLLLLVPSHAKGPNVGVTIMSGLFGVVLAVMLMLGFLLLCLVLANVLTRIVRMVFPNFAETKCVYAKGQNPAVVREENKRIAREWLVTELDRRIRESMRKRNVNMQSRTIGADTKAEWDLNELISIGKNIPKTTLAQPTPSTSELSDKAEFCLVRFPYGLQHPPRYLCKKVSVRGVGLRVFFACLPNRSIRLDYVSAQRLAATLPDTFVAPANSAARLIYKHHIRNGFHEEIKNATA